MLTVEALREVLKALGGNGANITDNMTIPEALLVIAAAIPAAIAAALPAVTAEDNGSVMKVIDGAWGVGTDEIQA
jgi:hypothetical protein